MENPAILTVMIAVLAGFASSRISIALPNVEIRSDASRFHDGRSSLTFVDELL